MSEEIDFVFEEKLSNYREVLFDDCKIKFVDLNHFKKPELYTKLIEYIKEHDIIFVFFTSFYLKKFLSKFLEYCESKSVDKNKIKFIVNDQEEYKVIKNNTILYDVEHVNISSLVETKFEAKDIKYDYIVNAVFEPYKNYKIINDNLSGKWVQISRKNDIYHKEIKEFFRLKNINLAFCPDKKLFRKDVFDLLNKSRAGIILSEVEGGCISSSEYLLCGLPVISVKSLGGRDDFYNEENSIVFDPEKITLSEAIDQFEIKFQYIDREKIRDNFIKQREIRKQRFIDILYRTFVQLNKEKYFEEFAKDLFYKNYCVYQIIRNDMRLM